MNLDQLKTISGKSISSISLGTWVFGAEGWGGSDRHDCHKALRTSFEEGVNSIDTAPIYGEGRSEEVIGEALPQNREDIFLATKCCAHKKGKKVWLDFAKDSILKEFDQSCQRLGVDHIDLYQIHWAYPEENIEGALEVLLELQNKGKIRYIGVSNFDVDLLKRALKVAPIATNQVPYSLLDRGIEEKILPFCQENGIGVLAYGPLAGGVLTGKYKEAPKLPVNDARSYFYKHYDQQGIDQANQILNQFETHEKGKAAINWVRKHSGVVSVLVGARNEAQARENASVMNDEY